MTSIRDIEKCQFIGQPNAYCEIWSKKTDPHLLKTDGGQSDSCLGSSIWLTSLSTDSETTAIIVYISTGT